MDGETAKVVVEVVSLIGGVIGLVTAIVSRRKVVLNRHEFVHRHVVEQGKREDLASGVFLCPECGGSVFKRVKGIYGMWSRLVLTFLLVWPWVAIVVVIATNTRSYRGSEWEIPVGGLCYMLPGALFWLVMRRPLLRCADCGARLPAKRARAEPPYVPSDLNENDDPLPGIG